MMKDAYMQESYASQGATALKNRTPFQDVGETFEQAIELARRVQRLAGLLVGDVPEDASATRAGSDCGGVLGDMAESALRVREYVRSAMQDLDRIEARLP